MNKAHGCRVYQGSQDRGMSFRFKTLAMKTSTMACMKTDNSCPFHAASPTAPVLHPAGTWPPGPPSGLTGWGLLLRMSRDLLGAFDDWRERYGPLVHLRIWPEHQIVVSAPQLVRELLVQHHEALVRWERGIAVMAQAHGQGVLVSEGAPWRAKRRAVQPSFLPKTVQAYAPHITAATGKALASWGSAGQDCAIEQAFNALSMSVILQVLFSAELAGDARIASAAVHTVSVAGNAEMYYPASWPDSMPWKWNKRRALRQLKRLVARHIAARLAMPAAQRPADVLGKLLALHADDALAWPMQAVHDECMSAFLAGHETTAATLTWWAWCMASHPEAQRAARQEVDAVLKGGTPGPEHLPQLAFLTRTLQETMRLYPAAPALLSRRSLAPITLGGWQFPAGTMFSIPVWSLHRDAHTFPDPQAFRPERFAPGAPELPRGAYLPFGAGPRVCLGQHLAMTEMTLVAAMLLQRFGLAVPDGMAAPLPSLNITLRPASALRLRLT
jgi:cytochrome P450